MVIHRTFRFSRLLSCLPVTAALSVASAASAAPVIVVTPGEQNTQSGENGCAAMPCAGGHWLHYPELLQLALGAGYTVQNNGDGGAVLGCDATTVDVAGGNSFCKSSKYTSSIAMPPGIVIIGPFGEHDQRIVAANAQNQAALYNQGVFEKAYEGLVQDYLKYTTKIYMMTPIDVPWGGTPTLPNGEDLVKDIMLPAALKVASDHSLPVIDTYTAISGTPGLVTMYYGNDGQVTSAGQQKMAELIEAALAAPPMGGSGGMGGGGTGGSAGANAGSGGSGGVNAGGSNGGVGGSSAGATAVAGSAGSASATAGNAAGGTGGAAGSSAAPGVQPTSSSSDSGGCAVSGRSQSGAALLALLGLAASVWLRRRRAS